MKKNIFHLLALAVMLSMALGLSAQEESDTLEAGPVESRHDPAWQTILPLHEFQFNIGDPVLLVNNSVLGYHNHSYGIFNNWGWYFNASSASTWPQPPGDYAITRYVPFFSFSYHYRVAKWFWVGGLATISGIHNTWRDRITDKITGHGNEILFSLMPDLRFSYLNKKHVTLYSGIGAGLRIYHLKDPKISLGLENGYTYNRTSLSYAFHLTLFGVKAGGRNWFGDLELGIGYKGFVSAGFGYEF